MPHHRYPDLNAKEIKQAAKTFVAYDDDGSGTLDASELVNSIVALGMTCSVEQAQASIDELESDASLTDAVHDGALNFHEFLFCVSKAKKEPGNENMIVAAAGNSVACSVM